MSVTSGFWFLAGVLSASAVWLLVGRGWQGLRTQSRWVLGGGAVAVFAALALYARLGSPQLLTTASAPMAGAPHTVGASAAGAAAAGDKGAGSMEAVIASLEQRLRSKGGADGDWELLAKSYEFLNRADAAALARSHTLPAENIAAAATGASAGASTAVMAGAIATPTPAPMQLTADSEKQLAQAEAARLKRDYKGAAQIYAKLAARQQMTAQSWADYADVSASMNGNSLRGEPQQYVQRALQLDPAHPKALWLQGSAQHETAQYAAAIATWQRLLALMDPDSSDAKLIRGNIEEDQRLGGSATPAPVQRVAQATGDNAATTPAAKGLRVSGEVTLSKEMQARVRPGQVLYIVAKSVNSPGMPVAVRREQTGTWPVRFELSDSDAMIPERRLSSVGPVTIEARISQGGQANSAPGDLLGSTAALDPAKAGPLRLVIDREVR